MGQLTDPDRHPIYFHMCHDVDTYANPAYVKSVSIKDSYNMCVVVSGTSGLTVKLAGFFFFFFFIVVGVVFLLFVCVCVCVCVFVCVCVCVCVI